MVGTVLGNAFDKAIGLTLRHWRTVLVVWIVMGAAYFFDQTSTQWIVGLLSLAIFPICAIFAARSLSSGFEIRSASILRSLLCLVLEYVVTLVPPAILAAIFIPSFLHAREVGDTSFGPIAGLLVTGAVAVALVFWIGTKWSLAAGLAFYRSRPVAASFRESWSLTTGMFWQTLLLAVAATLAFAALWFGANFVGGAIVGLIFVADHLDISKLALAARHTPAVLMPLLVYAGIAESIAYFLWLDRLLALRGDEASA